MQLIARLAEIAKEHRRLAEEAEQLIATINDRSAGEPPEDGADRLLTTAQAAKIARRSYTSLYRDAAVHGIGWKLRTGSWQFSEIALRNFLSLEKPGRGEVGEGGGEVGDGAPLPPANACAQSGEDKGD